MKIIIYIILLLFFCTFSSKAQTPYYWKLTDEDGLPSLEIYDLFQDSKGYVWIATDGGLCRYDGTTLKKYKHPQQKKTATTLIRESLDGRIWYKNFAGQLFYIDSTNQTQLFELSDSIKLNSYFTYTVTKKQLKIVSNSFFYDYTFSDQSWVTDTVKNCYQYGFTGSFLGVDFQEKNQVIYFDCFQNFFIKEKQTSYNKGAISPKELIVRGIHYLDKDSIALISSEHVYIDHIDKIAQLNPEAISLTHKGLLRIYPINKHKIWVTSTKGLILLEKNLQNNKWVEKKRLLESQSIGSFYQDREGNLWVGTLGNGVFIIPSLDIYYYDSKNSLLPNSKINCLEITDHQIFAGTDQGTVVKISPKTEKIDFFSLLTTHQIIGLFYDKKRHQVLAHSRKNYIIDLNKKKVLPSSLSFLDYNILYKEDQLVSGGLGVCITSNLSKTIEPPNEFKNQFEYTPDYKYGNVKKKRTTALWTDLFNKNTFWAGIDDTLFLYENAIPIPILTSNNKAILPSDIHQDQQGLIWVSTPNKGIYAIQNKKVIHHFTAKDGLPSNNCKRLTTYQDDIWIGTDKGIAKLTTTTKKIAIYNQLDGLLIDNIDDIEVLHQTVWAATSKGLISFDVNTPSTNTIAPYITISKCQINDSIYSPKDHFSLAYDNNSLEFSFKAIALKSRNNYTYEYRLIGLDSSWISQASTADFARFQKLNSGTYQFEVRARNEDGILSSTTPSISFIIHPPFWKTWWFISLAILTVLFLLILMIRFRYQSIQKKAETQNLITQLKMQALQTQMNPHFIFNAMSTIQSFWMYKDSKTALIYHAKFAKLMRLIFNYSNKKSIPIEDEIDFLKIYIDLEKIRLSYSISIDFEIDPILEEEEIQIAPLLIQPIIENSFKHGFLHKESACHLWIKLYKENNYVYCMIKDDGVGRKAAKNYNTWKDNKSKKRSSSFVTQDRLIMLNHAEGQFPNKITYKITDLNDAQNKSLGTQVELWIPILNNFSF